MTTLRDKWNSRNAEWLEHYHAPENEKARSADLDRRLHAAGIDVDRPEDENIEVFRYKLARKIRMFINDWPGCPEGVCRRMRGCMAPNGECANAEPLPPDPDDVEWDQARFEIRRALDEMLVERAAEDEPDIRQARVPAVNDRRPNLLYMFEYLKVSQGLCPRPSQQQVRRLTGIAGASNRAGCRLLTLLA